MKKIIPIVLLLILNIDTQAQSFGAVNIENNSFSLWHSAGDLRMRRYYDGDTTWKRALVPTSSTLYMNYSGDFTNGVRIQGPKLVIEGNVGIGTSNPSSKLEVYGGGDLLIKGANNDAGDLIFQNNLSSQLGRIWTNYSGNSGLYLSSGDNYPDLTISSTGYVGIGTSNPDGKLTVKGKIHCEEVQVDLAVPADYVFEKYYTGTSNLKATYTMPTLEEVEAYTKENHHLPSMPSAKTIQKEGLHLKEMTNLLLQKIEELTLYTIEQEKRIKALEGKLTTEK